LITGCSAAFVLRQFFVALDTVRLPVFRGAEFVGEDRFIRLKTSASMSEMCRGQPIKPDGSAVSCSVRRFPS